MTRPVYYAGVVLNESYSDIIMTHPYKGVLSPVGSGERRVRCGISTYRFKRLQNSLNFDNNFFFLNTPLLFIRSAFRYSFVCYRPMIAQSHSTSLYTQCNNIKVFKFNITILTIIIN